jgi:hypothetical protein
MGIDIDGTFGATVIRQGYVVDGMIGLNLERNGIWQGNRLSDVAIFGYLLPDDHIKAHARTSQEEEAEMKLHLDLVKEHTFGSAAFSLK